MKYEYILNMVFEDGVYETYKQYVYGRMGETTKYRYLKMLKNIYKKDVPPIYSKLVIGHNIDSVKEEVKEIARMEQEVIRKLDEAGFSIKPEVKTRKTHAPPIVTDDAMRIIEQSVKQQTPDGAKEYLKDLYNKKYITKEQAYKLFDDSF